MVDIMNFTPVVRNYIIHYLTGKYNEWDFKGRIMIPNGLAHKFDAKYPEKQFDYIKVQDDVSYDIGQIILFQEDNKTFGVRLEEGAHNIVIPIEVLTQSENLSDAMLAKCGYSIFAIYEGKVYARFFIDEDEDSAEVEIFGLKFKSFKAFFGDLHTIADKANLKVEGYDVHITTEPKDVLKYDRVLLELGTYDKSTNKFKPTGQLLNKPKTDKFVIGKRIYDYKSKGRMPQKRNSFIVGNRVFVKCTEKSLINIDDFGLIAQTRNYVLLEVDGETRLMSKKHIGFKDKDKITFMRSGKHKIILKDMETDETITVNDVSSMLISSKYFNTDTFAQIKITQFDDIVFDNPLRIDYYISRLFKLDQIQYDSYEHFIEARTYAVATFQERRNIATLFYRDGNLVGVLDKEALYVVDKPVKGAPDTLISKSEIFDVYYLWKLKDDKTFEQKLLGKEVSQTILSRIPLLKIL